MGRSGSADAAGLGYDVRLVFVLGILECPRPNTECFFLTCWLVCDGIGMVRFHCVMCAGLILGLPLRTNVKVGKEYMSGGRCTN